MATAGPTIETTVPPYVVFNHDVVGIYNRWQRFLQEIAEATSANTLQFNAFDQTRLASYLDAMDGYNAWVVAQPQLDLPKTSPRAYQLLQPYTPPETENQEIADLLRVLLVARDEIISSESARNGSGLVKFDLERQTSYIAKVRTFLTTYIQKVTPLDMPEAGGQTPPTEAPTGPGQQPVQR